MRIPIFAIVIALAFNSVALAAPAFPGAVGVGADTVGGRGGKVIHVTNLNDGGAGSLREALATPGPRTIVFDVSGNISLTSLLYVKEPYVTIAGQTSPGGISVSGKQFNVSTHDVIIRHMRFRSGGYMYTGDNSDGDSFSLWGPNWNGGVPVYNIMIDHCSFTWGTDETLAITGGSTKTTLQNNLIAQGLRYAKLGTTDHSKGLMISGKYKYDTEVSLYRNFIAHNTDRNPMMYNPVADNTSMLVDGTNNVIYNWKGGITPEVLGDAKVNWIANYAKEGPYSNRRNFFLGGDALPSPAEKLIYVKGNLGTGKTATDPEWMVSVSYTSTALTNAYQRLERWSLAQPLPFDTMTPGLATTIVAASGATVPIRDSVDTAIVKSYDAGTSLLKDRVSYPADWPVYAQIAPPADSDRDGMPDYWETAKGLNNDLNDSAADPDGNGYTNLEEYLNTLAETRPLPPQNLRLQ